MANTVDNLTDLLAIEALEKGLKLEGDRLAIGKIIQDELAALNFPSAAIAIGKIKGTAQNNLNSTVAGTPVVFDPSTFQGDTMFTPSASGLSPSEGGIYLATFTLSSFVASNGVQRASVAVRLTVDGAQGSITGRTGYMRRISGHNRGTTQVENTLNTAGNQIIGAIGFRDAIAGTVTTNAAETQLLLLKIS